MTLEKTGRNDDGALERSVERQISQRTWGRIHHLQVELSGNRLIVHGTVGSYFAKQLALEGALEALGSTGATAVDLEIQVGAAAFPDRRLKSAALAAV